MAPDVKAVRGVVRGAAKRDGHVQVQIEGTDAKAVASYWYKLWVAAGR